MTEEFDIENTLARFDIENIPFQANMGVRVLVMVWSDLSSLATGQVDSGGWWQCDNWEEEKVDK